MPITWKSNNSQATISTADQNMLDRADAIFDAIDTGTFVFDDHVSAESIGR